MVLRIGHRGCFKNENTLSSILHAINILKVDVIEIDIRLTKDNIPVLHHDSNFENVEIYEHTYSELLKYKKIDTLTEVLKNIPKKIQIYLDLKKHSLTFNNNYIETLENIICNILKKLDSHDNIIIASFDHDMVRRILQKCINNKILFIKTCYICHEFPINLLDSYLKNNDLDYLSVNKESVNKEMIKLCHLNNVNLLVYTVNKVTQMKELINIGVNGIISDYPQRIPII